MSLPIEIIKIAIYITLFVVFAYRVWTLTSKFIKKHKKKDSDLSDLEF